MAKRRPHRLVEHLLRLDRCHQRTAANMKGDPTRTWEQELAWWCAQCLYVTAVMQREPIGVGRPNADRFARNFRILLGRYPCAKVDEQAVPGRL